ncbi:universal stress protein [Thalassotalea sp. LPB0316]|uniref:universal stress protein n=1 Tax=Thalassotalea sp. LPB0316 TaxID=2769490 RepID=UPI0018696731|nr:universal stress protein [Thalassotalea sp. LPB0316]QOL26732.1 universal stress protein [Thalassotalea sp. LPB0316]
MSHILVVADLLDNNPVATLKASELAQQSKLPVKFVFFCHDNITHLDNDQEQVKAQIIKRVEQQSQALLTEHVPADVEYSFEVVWEKRIHQWVNRYVDNNDVSFVVKTGHRTETMMYTSTDWHLLRECNAPIYISSEKQWRRAQHVLASLDLETKNEEKLALNSKILEQAKELASASKSQLHVCYTVPFSRLLHDFGMQFRDELEIKAEKKLKPVIEALSKEHDIPIERFHIKAGEPEKVIPSTAASVKAAVVVLGMVGRKGLSGKIIGNTAEKILALLKTDLVAVKP